MKIVIVGLSLLLAACGSTSRRAANIIRPVIQVAQISGVPPAARHITGALPVRFAVRVSNKSVEQITLRQVTIRSIGEGAYSLEPTSRSYDVAIAPDGVTDVELWASGFIGTATMVGANGPVTVRLNLVFDSPEGTFEEIVMTQVNEREGMGGTGPG